MSPGGKSYKMKMRDVETAFKYRRIPYPKRSVELIALLAISCTFFLFMHTNKLNSRLKEMEMKLQPSEFSALGLTGSNHLDSAKHDDINTLHGTYQYLKSTGQQRLQRPRPGRLQTPKEVKQELSLQKPRNENHENDKQKGLSKQHDQLHQYTANIDNNNSNEDEDEDDAEDEDDEYEEEYENSLKVVADALNNTKKAQSQDVIIFNRVPKVGSQSLMTLMRELGKVNNFQHYRDKGKGHETILLKPDDQKQLINEIYQLPQPHVYSQHLAFINFTQFRTPKPIYINLVRDPVERIISWHYYIRAEWYYKSMNAKLGDKAPKRPSDEFMNMDFDTCLKTNNIYCTFNQMDAKNPTGDHRRQTLFFCGQNKKLCMPFNSPAAMQKAKRTVEEEYAVVGTWEDTNITLSVLEHYIPRFFRNAKAAYHLNIERFSKVNKNKGKRPVSELSRQLLRKNLTHEIEFYEFCKQRLYMQYAAISGDNGYNLDNDDYAIIPDNEEYDYDDES